jgi:hypothetical protein
LLGQHNIKPIPFPLYTSHLFRPLDLVAFAAFKLEKQEIHIDRPAQSQVWQISKLIKLNEMSNFIHTSQECWREWRHWRVEKRSPEPGVSDFQISECGLFPAREKEPFARWCYQKDLHLLPSEINIPALCRDVESIGTMARVATLCGAPIHRKLATCQNGAFSRFRRGSRAGFAWKSCLIDYLEPVKKLFRSSSM